MNEQTRTAKLGPQAKKAQGGVGAPHLHEGGSRGNPSGPRDANDPGSTRYGDRRPNRTHGRDEDAPGPSQAATEPRRGTAR